MPLELPETTRDRDRKLAQEARRVQNGFANLGLDESDFEGNPGIAIHSFDAFPKTKESYLTSSTTAGGVGTLVLTVLALVLVVSEFSRWIEGTTLHTYSVEKGVAHELQINMDIIVMMHCKDLHVNVQDASGDRIAAGEKLKLEDTRWDQWGSRVPKKAGEEGALPPWLREQFKQYSKVEDVHEYLAQARGKRKFKKTPWLKGKQADACRIFGSIDGNKVQGDFHITARGHGYGDMGEHLDHGRFNFTHHISELSFGPFYPNLENPLDETDSGPAPDHFYKYQYYLSVVPTIYTDYVEALQTSSPPHIAHARALARLQSRAQQGMFDEEPLALQGEMREDDADRRAGQPGNKNKKQSSLFGGMVQGLPLAHQLPEDLKADPGLNFNPFAHPPHTIYTNQYAVTHYTSPVHERATPGIFIKYDIEPILLTVSEEWGGALGLLMRVVNVVAGVMVGGGWIMRLSDWTLDVIGKRRARRASMMSGMLHGKMEKESLD